MAFTGTKIADIINPEVLADQMAAKFPEFLVFANSGLVDLDTDFPMGTPGTQQTIPFWKQIGSFAALTEGEAMTTGKITASSEKFVVERAGIALEVADTAVLVSKADPMPEIVNQISRRAAEYLDAALVTKADKTPNVVDKTAASTAGTLEPNFIIDSTISKLGDQFQAVMGGGALVMHSKQYKDLLQLGVIQNVYQSGMDVLKSGTIPTLLGMPIIVSDRVTTATESTQLRYYCYVVGPKALAMFFQRAVQVEFDRDPLVQSNIVVATVHYAAHLYGWDDATDALAAESAKSIGVVRIKTK